MIEGSGRRYIVLIYPVPEGPNTHRCYGSGSATLSGKVWIRLGPDPKLHFMRILNIIIMFACFFTPNAFGVARWNCWASSVWMSARRPCRWLKLVSGTSTTAPVVEQRFLIIGTTDVTDASVSDKNIPGTDSQDFDPSMHISLFRLRIFFYLIFFY